MRPVISASRRTDIPAFYLPWLVDRVRNGHVDVASPFNRAQVKRVSLRPADVSWIVFWSRDYGPFLKAREAFHDYRVAFHFTITAGHEVMEPGVPAIVTALDQAGSLASAYGGDRVSWRYDPLAWWRDAGDVLRTNHSAAVFEQLCRELSAVGIRRCITSVATWYRKARVRMSRVEPALSPVDPSTSDIAALYSEMRDVAESYGIELAACCSSPLLELGAQSARCIDAVSLSGLGGERVSHARTPTRDGCGCTAAVDIGDYELQPCRYGCLYCYAKPL